MVKELNPIDISNIPELVRLVEEVRRTDKPCVLRRDDEDLAILSPAKPVSTSKRKSEKTRANYEAFRSAAGGWKDVDTDKLIADIYADRRISDRPPIEL